MNETTPKQQIVDKIKNSTNILVTVSRNPNVDELSAAIGLTLMLNKLGKHATAVFSGAVPPAITFLDPEKTLENTVDSLRDFIIALDKEKADRLRYRVEDDTVRIFITPYRTKITQEDLEFTHGDFNVELVLALGVESQDELDEAIAAHGKILHDATVATLSARDKKSTLGSIDWQDAQASSLSEMLVAISESIKGPDALLDEQIATALLTGIVSATHRFSNDHTSPKAMTMAAQLMAAGANQQLIASQLEGSDGMEVAETAQKNSDGSITLTEDEVEEIKDTDGEPPNEPAPRDDEQDLGEMIVEHQETNMTEVVDKPKEPAVLPRVTSATIEEHDQRNKKLASEAALDEALKKLGTTSEATPTLADLEAETHHAATTTEAKIPAEKPRMGSAFNAMAQEAEVMRGDQDTLPQVSEVASPDEPLVSTKAPTLQPIHGATLAELEQEAKQPTVANQPATLPAVDTASVARQEVADLFATSSPAPTQTVPSPSPTVDEPALVAPLPPPPPLPDFSTLPPLPPTAPEAPALDPTPAAPPAPDQFRIPGA